MKETKSTKPNAELEESLDLSLQENLTQTASEPSGVDDKGDIYVPPTKPVH